MLTPVDLETTVFRRGFRGYKTQEVQEFMTRLTHDYERLYRDNIDLKEKIEALEAKLNQYQMMEETLRNAMVLAQETAEEVKNSARQQATLVIREAETEAERIRTGIREEIRDELRRLALLKNQTEFFRCQFKSFLNGLAEMADKQLNLQMEWEPSSSAVGEKQSPRGDQSF